MLQKKAIEKLQEQKTAAAYNDAFEKEADRLNKIAQESYKTYLMNIRKRITTSRARWTV